MTEKEGFDTAPFGVQGLDQLLGGGLWRGRPYIIYGGPGTCKTTLSLHFAMDGAQRGESVLYVTFSESRTDLNLVAKSHEWDLGGIDVMDLTEEIATQHTEKQQTVLSSDEVEFNELVESVLQSIREKKPQRLVIDSMTDLRVLANNPILFRRQIFALKRLSRELGSTMLLIDLPTGGVQQSEILDLAHGVILLEERMAAYGRSRRRLQIEKMRAKSFPTGYHDMTIDAGGLQVHPRLEPQHRKAELSEVMSSGIQGLDDLFGGGLVSGTSSLFLGPAGSGKTSLSTLYVHTAARRGERSSVYLFDETTATFERRAEGLGVPVKDFVDQGLILERQLAAGEISPGEFSNLVKQDVEEHGSKIVIIDSLTGYAFTMLEESLLIVHLHELVNYLSSRGVLTLMVSTEHGLLSPIGYREKVELSYLADSVLLSRHFEAEGVVRQAISVIKKRYGSHEHSIRELQFGRGRIEIGPPLKEFGAVLSGSPRFEGNRDQLLASFEGERGRSEKGETNQ
ncbi:MAG: hypothetical protein E1N59_1023 [Puniceicoccaceae bacterium 5H]|nr:MAG: hypothetical protein E1N59_1023 [Puniceicoccaceae bacterium 5H]